MKPILAIFGGVIGVDTKNKGARAKFKGAKIVTEAI